MFETVVEILKLLWKNDDYLEQEDLFEIQDKTADLAWKMAEKSKKRRNLLSKEFPFLFN